jgi:hypothetical protein
MPNHLRVALYLNYRDGSRAIIFTHFTLPCADSMCALCDRMQASLYTVDIQPTVLHGLQRIVTGGQDYRILLWDLAAVRNIRSEPQDDEETALCTLTRHEGKVEFFRQGASSG